MGEAFATQKARASEHLLNRSDSRHWGHPLIFGVISNHESTLNGYKTTVHPYS